MSANGALTSTLDFSFFGGGYSTIVGGAEGTFNYAFTSDVFVPVYATLDQTISFDVEAGIVTPTVYGEFSGTIDFTLTEPARIEFGIQSYIYSGNNEINFTASASGFSIIAGGANITLPITFSGTMAQFSLGQTTNAFGYALNSKVINYTLTNKSRLGINDIELTRNMENGVVIRRISEPNDIRLKDSGETFAEVR
jgi:hypothetical protein|tara:strand:+ start:917 stop:1504 length:588 start_codon:yes stop_codon:yes gene_type:complete